MLVFSRRQATDDVLWRNIKNTTFWDKEVWIFPVHRSSPGHWVLCTAYIRERRLLLFDSLGGRRDWDNDVKVYPQISLSINILANRRNAGYHSFDRARNSSGSSSRPHTKHITERSMDRTASFRMPSTTIYMLLISLINLTDEALPNKFI
jgi:hypothetical protein